MTASIIPHSIKADSTLREVEKAFGQELLIDQT